MTMPDTGGIGIYLDYCLSPKGRNEKEDPSRVLGVVSTFLHGDPDGVKVELKLSEGKKAGGICERISPDPKDAGKIKTMEEWKRFFSECAEELEPNTPYFIVLHGDACGGAVPHGHVFLPWRYIDLKHHATAEAIRRQDAIDRVCRRWGLSVVERQPGTFNRAQNRTPLSSIRATEAGRYSWMTDLKNRVDEAMKRATDREEFGGLLSLQGVQVRFRGNGISYSFKDQAGKNRVIRGKRLGTDYMLSSAHDFATGPVPVRRGANRTVSKTPTTTGGAQAKTTAVVASSGGGGGHRSDKRGMDEVSREALEAGERAQDEAISAQEQANRQLAETLSRGGR
jgi:hypothetical protein